ncbi:DUF1707 domain-containing protein [Streptomyces fimicarius]|uniref:DUF1707 SHOCT-like domain-containing protein n=1 Tax=Streptomyces griseus TaxID=1911 RepID=UPI00369839A5
MTAPRRSDSTRVGADDREGAVRRVREAYAEERIAHEEMDDRLGRVLAATTHGELAAALDSLPAEDPATGWKDLRYRPRQPSRPDAPRIRFSGAMGYGRLKIRHAWR